MKKRLLSQMNTLLLIIWVLALFCGVQSAQAATTTYSIFERFIEPMTQPYDSIFIGTFDYDAATKTVTNLKGILSESMTGTTPGGYPNDDMTWLTLNNQLVSWHDATLGGTFAAVFKNSDTKTFWTNGGTLDGWSPQAGIDAGSAYYGFPTPANNPGNAYALIFVPDNPLVPLTQTQIDKLAYADFAPGGMMGSVGMTGVLVRGTGPIDPMTGLPIDSIAGTMGGYPVEQVITYADAVPDAFSFTPASGVNAGTNIDSGIITVTGINTPAAISIVGGKYAISTDSGGSWSAWVTTAGTVANNNQVKVQVAASALANTAATATLTIGGVSGGFTATTNGYAAPPTWMPMTMLNITLSSGQLAIVDEATKSPFSGTPATTWPALSTVTPAGIFDPAKPWALLTGTAYSRRLGWNPGTGLNASAVQTAFGSNASIWIERTGGSAGFGTYQAVGKYGVNNNGTASVDAAVNGYTPIFGTAGSSTKWQWDYMMDHNVNAVPAAYITTPNQLFTATYRLYIGDSAGNDIAPTAATTTTWTWQGPATVPDTTPDAFTFTSQGPVAFSTIIESNAITVSGIDSTALISITGGEYAVSTDGGTNWSAYSSTIPATVAVGNQVKVRQTSSASQGATTIAALTIGGVTGNFSVTTLQVFTITATAGSDGSITPSGNVLVEQNKDQTFGISPNSGYIIHDVIVDGSTVGAVASYTFTHVIADHTILATFIAHQAKNARTGITYPSVQEAYNAAGDGDEIQLYSGIIDGPLVAERANINVTLTGGYDSGFTSDTGTTAIQGKLSIKNGSVHVRNVRLY